jgi:outer membrane immunogenic protein
MKIFLGSLALAAMIAGPAMAADMPLKAAPPAVAAFSWAGCYVGVEGGGAFGRSRVDMVPAAFPQAAVFGNPLTPRFDVSGGLLGVEYGCNQQIGSNWVVGLEGDISWTNKKGSSFETAPLATALGFNTLKDETSETWITTARLRFGYTWDRTLVFVTGGLAAAGVQSTLTVPVPGFPISNGVYPETHTQFGWTVGGGIEYAFLNNWSLKAEYLHVGLKNEPILFLRTLVAAVPRTGVNLDNDIVRVGVNWRFGCLANCGVVAKY